LPNASYFPADGTINTYIGTYFLVRDSYTGCAYTQDSVNNFMIAGQTQNGYNAPFLSKSRTTANWNDQAQMTLHTNASLAIPERCYANGFLAPSFSNSVAWTRTPEHVAGQAPDDAYVSGVISASELTNIMNATNCGATNLEACTLIQFTFKIPSMPGTPAMPSYNCQGHPGSCVLPGSQTALRYMSLTFGYQPGGQGSIIDDIDGENPTVTTDSTSLVSLADAAFNAAATFNSSTNVYPAQYVSLVVNVNPVLGGASLPIGLSYTPQGATTSTGYDVTSTAIMQGAGPVTTGSNNFTAWVNSFGSSYQPLVVLDLTQFEQFYSASCTGTPPNVQCTIPLVLTLRSTVLGPDPNNQMEPFTCSAFNVPYSTAAYTNADDLGGGFMGPYLPLASYPTVSSLLTPSPPLGSGSFPSEGSCTALSVNSPHPFPSGNLANISQLSQFPVQYFSNSAQAPPYLNCGNGSSTFLPEIYYAGTQFTVEAVASGEPGYVPPPSFSATSPCDYPDAASGGLNTNPCIQIIQQATENESTTAYQPPLPLTIIGKGFGYLSGLPQASGSPNYLTIQDNTAGWVTTSGACQVFILDWNDTLISVLLGLPPNHTVKNGEGQFLNPLADMSPASFFQGTSGTVGCAVKPGDSLTVTVANPQQPANTGSLAEPVIVGAYSTTTPY
jgi:hypothetical protein